RRGLRPPEEPAKPGEELRSARRLSARVRSQTRTAREAGGSAAGSCLLLTGTTRCRSPLRCPITFARFESPCAALLAAAIVGVRTSTREVSTAGLRGTEVPRRCATRRARADGRRRAPRAADRAVDSGASAASSACSLPIALCGWRRFERAGVFLDGDLNRVPARQIGKHAVQHVAPASERDRTA